MSSRFVSGGTIAGDDTTTTAATTTSTSSAAPPSSASSAWEKAQAQLESDRRAREAARKTAIESNSGQSLYDVLQANKAAKQAAFEEANKIRNQFRALDDDEVDFLDGMAEEERKKLDEQKRAEEEGLKVFRDAQKKSKPVEAADDEPVAEEVIDEWSTAGAKKRKREKEPIIKGIKGRVSQNATAAESGADAKDTSPTTSTKAPVAEPPSVAPKPASSPEAKPVLPASTAKSKMGLVDYGSDEDEDED
ncbi:hypothetical protein E8E14_010974 [Neopestalotiopsis sp. 37M]|nr:hypothetical protein E8E14_010974 [Neopestalotiopsis sp. 37M]